MNNFNLERADLLQLEPITNRGTLKLLPLGKKNKQKLLIGDDSGNVGCYEFKKGEPQVVFQAKVFDGPITCLQLGGNPQKRDKFFVSHSQRIVGLTKKGKEFFKLTSSLTETIQNIATEDTRIWTGCEYIYNLYDNGKDAAYYISKGYINHLIVTHLTRENDFDVILACQDKYIRIIHVSQQFLEIPTNHPVTTVTQMYFEKEPVYSTKVPGFLVYGTSKGTLGLVQVSNNASYDHIWEIEDSESNVSSINCIKLYDINKDDTLEIIVGRDDGRVEVFRVQSDNYHLEPTKIFSKNIGQSIRSVECGIVNTPDFPEILVAAYSGKVISFTTEPIRSRAQDDSYGRSVQTVNNENRIKNLKKEVEDLKKKVEKEREKLKKANISSNLPILKPAPDFNINSKFELDSKLAAYMLSLELQSPMDLIILRSPVILDLIESEGTNTVVSVTPPHLQPQGSSEDQSGRYVAVFRCQGQEKRIAMALRTNEGEYGDLVITVVNNMNPKAAKILKYELKPLSLNMKLHILTSEDLARPRNRIRYSANLPFSTVHEWIQALFPDVPPRLDENETEQKYFFRNTFTQAVTLCEIRRNEIIIESENASTIAIAKENLTRLANYRRVTLDENVSPNEASISSFLGLIREKLEYQLSLSRKVQLVDAIQELAQQDSSPSWMTEEYVQILKDQEIIRKEFKTRDRSLEYLMGIITDLFVDWNRIQGIDVKRKIPQLQGVIMNGDFTQIVKFFSLR